MSVLLRCRVGGSSAVPEQATHYPGAAEWAQEVVAASRPGSAAANGALPPPLWTDPPVTSELCPQELPRSAQAASLPGVVAVGAGLEPAASFASLPPGLEVDAQRARSLGQAVAAWQAATAPTAAPQGCGGPATSLLPRHLQEQQVSGPDEQQMQQALLAWQSASLAAAPEQQQQHPQQQQAAHPGMGADITAESPSRASVENAVAGCSRPNSAGRSHSVLLRVAVPAASAAQPAWPPAAFEPPTSSFTSPAHPQPAYPVAAQPPWAPWLSSQASPPPSSVHSKYPQVWHTPEAPGGPAGMFTTSWPEPESPRILAYPEPSGMDCVAAPPPALASGAALMAAAAPGNGPGTAVAATCAERMQALRECLVAWRRLASAATAAQRAAELRGCARAEDFWEARLLQQCFGAWRHQCVAVQGQLSSTAQRHAFVKVSTGLERGHELGQTWQDSSLKVG